MGGRLNERQASGRAGRRFAAIWIAATVLLATASSRAADIPTLLVLPLEIADTSGETPSRAKELEDRLTTLTLYLSRELGAHGLYAVIDPISIGSEIDKVRATQPLDRCNGCERDLARLVHADRVLIGAVDKVSTLIGSLRLRIVDVATGQSIFSRVLGFRGDTDEAWQRAARFFVRDLEATAAERGERVRVTHADIPEFSTLGWKLMGSLRSTHPTSCASLQEWVERGDTHHPRMPVPDILTLL